LDLQKQVKTVIGISIIFGVVFNTLRDNGIPWISKPITKVVDTKDIEDNLNEPSIREIGLELAKHLQSNGILFVDARAEEYLEDGYIPGAIANDDADRLSDQVETLIGFDQAFVIYCSDDDCGSSEDLAYELQELGFNHILVFKGGWKSWLEAGLEVEHRE